MFESQHSCPVPATCSALPRVWWIRVACLAWLLSSVGCFEKTYADRMAVTVKLYEHVDLLNRNLNPEFSDAGFKLRAPLGFDFIPKPVPPPRDPKLPPPAPGTEEILDDPRQPGYLGITFPGMVAAWQKTVAVDEPQGTINRKAYIYLLSNRSLFSVSPDVPGRIDPLKFQEHVVNLLANELAVQFKDNEWRREEYPVDFKLVPKVTYDYLMFSPERLFEETKMTFRIYITSQKDTQALLLIVYPDLTSPNEKFGERIPLCLETLQLPVTGTTAATPGTTGPGNTPAF